MKLHHIGVIVKDIPESIEVYQKLLGLAVVAETGIDPVQKADAAFLDIGWGEGITLELLRPTSTDSPIMNALKRGGGLHHLCFEVEDIDEEVHRIREKGGKVISGPVPACGLRNRRIAFIFPVDNILVELVERERKP